MTLPIIENSLTWKQLCEVLSIPDLEKTEEELSDTCFAESYFYSSARIAAKSRLGSTACDEDVDDLALEIEGEWIGEEVSNHMQKLKRAILRVARDHFDNFQVDLIGDDESFVLQPQKDWETSCEALREVINGYGVFYFESIEQLQESGPYETLEQVFLNHLNYVGSRCSQVYGLSSPESQIENMLR